jgi:hypothetical protein
MFAMCFAAIEFVNWIERIDSCKYSYMPDYNTFLKKIWYVFYGDGDTIMIALCISGGFAMPSAGLIYSISAIMP